MDYRVKIFAFDILMAITEVWSLISLYILYLHTFDTTISCGPLPFKTDSQHFRHITVGRLYNFRQWRIGFIHSERRESSLIGHLSQCKFTLWNITWQLFEDLANHYTSLLVTIYRLFNNPYIILLLGLDSFIAPKKKKVYNNISPFCSCPGSWHLALMLSISSNKLKCTFLSSSQAIETRSFYCLRKLALHIDSSLPEISPDGFRFPCAFCRAPQPLSFVISLTHTQLLLLWLDR